MLIGAEVVPDGIVVPLILIVDNGSTAVGVKVKDVIETATLKLYSVIAGSKSGLIRYPSETIKVFNSVESLTSLTVTPETLTPDIRIL
jgi:hypothetical protein